MNEINLTEATSFRDEFNKNNIPYFVNIKERCAATYQATFSEVIKGLENGNRYFFGNAFGGENAGIWEFQLLPIPPAWTEKNGQYYLEIRILNYECIVKPIII